MIVSIGNDILELDRFDRILEKHEDRFISRVFTANEQDYCCSQAKPARHFAVRFAAKEAVLKALGTGWSQGIHWKDIEVLRNSKGDPYIALHGVAADIAVGLRIHTLHLSLSHSQNIALATIVAEGYDQESQS